MDKSFLLYRLSKIIKKLSIEQFIFLATLAFYGILYIFNPSNKIIVALFLILPFLYAFKLKDLRQSLLLAYLTSLLILTGKTYQTEIIKPGFFDEYLFPDGVNMQLTITSSHILSVIMLPVVFRDLVLKKVRIFKFNFYDYIIIGYFCWLFISSYFGSKWIEISLIQNALTLPHLIVYIYIRIYKGTFKNFIAAIIALVSAQIIFEAFISLRQLIYASPSGKNIESIVIIDADMFGLSPDDIALNFRPFGTFGHSNNLGSWLGFNLLLIFPFFYKKSKNNLYLLISLLIGIISLAATLSRSAWLGSLFGFLFCLFIVEKLKKLKTPAVIMKLPKSVYVLLIAVIFLFIIPRAISSVNTFTEGTGQLRKTQNKETLGLINANPIFGIGKGMSLSEAIKNNPKGVFKEAGLTVHNWYLLVASESGMPIMMIFAVLIYLAFRINLEKIVKGELIRDIDFLRVGSLGAVLSLLIVALFQPFISEGSIFFLVALLNNSGTQMNNGHS